MATMRPRIALCEGLSPTLRTSHAVLSTGLIPWVLNRQENVGLMQLAVYKKIHAIQPESIHVRSAAL
ncbi:MAG: hypothetical protein OET90_05440, partial [Desulfuromonadales bacterium]|nr:hypothetical protein [Desulfuromonadales bacterium]